MKHPIQTWGCPHCVQFPVGTKAECPHCDMCEDCEEIFDPDNTQSAYAYKYHDKVLCPRCCEKLNIYQDCGV